MKLAKQAFLVTLSILALLMSMSAQTLRPESDPRNTAPTVGTGGPMGGATGLFTVYDGQTLRKGEYTFSAAYSNFDRDPGNADFVEVPVSFQIGVSDHLEFFFNTDAYRGVKVNSPRNLSGFYLPNSQVRIGSVLTSAGAIVLAPQGPGTSQFANFSVYRPVGNQGFVQFPYVGGNAGTFGFSFANPGTVFGFPSGNPLLGPPRAGGNGADLFPGIGSPYGGILPGIVLQTVALGTTTAPTVFTVAPSYLPDAPFLNREYGESAFSTFTAGGKWRWTGPNNPLGVGVVAYYRWYGDTASDASGFNQLQRGASPGGNRGDIGVTMFADARVRKWMNISANLGYHYNSSIKGEFPSGTFTLLDRPDEVLAAIGIDFPVNKHFQPILEFRSTQYVGGRTPNALENSPIDAIAGFRWFPTRWMSLGGAYRYHVNQQDRGSFKDSSFNSTVTVGGRTGTTAPVTQTIVSQGIPAGLAPSSDANGFIGQFTIGRRNKRDEKVDTPKPFSDVTGLTLDRKEVTLPCPPGQTSGSCNDNTSVNVSTSATNPDNDSLLYNYTVSGGRIVGSGSNVSWDLSGARPGTYTITSAADNGCGFCGKTKTETIEVKECSDCRTPCSCPSLSIAGPSQAVKVGDPMTFTASASGGSMDGVRYNWTVSQGTITQGQGTSVITVDTTGLACGTTVTATAEISGDGLCADCAKTASETGSVAECRVIEPRKVAEQGVAPDDDVKAALQNIRDTELGNDPTAQLYIINTGSAKAKAKRLAQLKRAIPFVGIDPSRVVIVDGGTSGKELTEYWIVPAGAQPPPM